MKRLLRRISEFYRTIMRRSCTPEQLRGYGAEVGNNVYIGTRRIDIAHAFLIKIGNNVTISDARLLTHDASTKYALGYSKVGRIVIGDEVFIGAEAIILPNVKIGSRVIIGAGAVIAKDVPDNSVVVGNPSRVICSYDTYIQKNRDMMKTAPVYGTHYSQKSAQEIEQMREALMDGGIGYDV